MRSNPLAAGAAYFAAAFAAGFALGMVRVAVLEPWLGALPAVLVELPVILTIAWLACGWLVTWLRIPARAGPRLVMGGSAFGLLLAAEIAMSTLLLGRTLEEVVAGFGSSAGAVGLAGQVLFALLPMLRGGPESPSPRAGSAAS